MTTQMSAQVESVIIAYAKANPMVLRSWLYGSRICGEPRADSDLDVGFELDNTARPQKWDNRPESWERERQKLVRVIEPLIKEVLRSIPIDIRFLYSDTFEPDLRTSFARGRLIYERCR